MTLKQSYFSGSYSQQKKIHQEAHFVVVMLGEDIFLIFYKFYDIVILITINIVMN